MRRFATACLLLLVTACDGDTGGADASATTPAGTGGAPATPARGAPPPAGGDLGEPATVIEGLEVPWDLAFVDHDTFLVTERAGRVRAVEGGRLRAEPVARYPVEATGEGGLLGLVLHPDFPRERVAYVFYTAADGNRVVRAPVGEDLTFGPEEILVGGIPAARIHDGGRLGFGPDGMLYVTTGDAGEPRRAADRSSPAGKILRLRPDGSIPADNPFPGSPVWSYGHRNPQGIGWDRAGNLYASEHGPSGEWGLCCHDELNLIIAGHFYGWPHLAGTVRTGEGDPPAEPAAPIASSGESTWAPAGVAVRTRADGDTEVHIANLRGAGVARLRIPAGRPAEVADQETAFSGSGRLRDATFGPDGCLYLTTSNRDGRGDPQPGDDRVLRSCPR